MFLMFNQKHILQSQYTAVFNLLSSTDNVISSAQSVTCQKKSINNNKIEPQIQSNMIFRGEICNKGKVLENQGRIGVKTSKVVHSRSSSLLQN